MIIYFKGVRDTFGDGFERALGEGYSQKNRVGVIGPLLKTLTLLRSPKSAPRFDL